MSASPLSRRLPLHSNLVLTEFLETGIGAKHILEELLRRHPSLEAELGGGIVSNDLRSGRANARRVIREKRIIAEEQTSVDQVASRRC